MRRIPIGIQLYTVQAEMNADPRKAIEAVAKIGYEAVEGGTDTYGIPAKEYKKLLHDRGLKLTTLFSGVDEMERDLRPKIDLALDIGAKRIGIPYLDEGRRKDADGWKKVAEIANRAAAQCNQHSLEFIYHNHSFEFARFDGAYGLDVFYANTDPHLVKAELDTYWIQHGGESPAEYIRKYSGRVALLHMKDMLADAPRSFAEVGEGILDWGAILEAASHSTCAFLLVEQDVCRRPCLESAALSYRNLKRMVG